MYFIPVKKARRAVLYLRKDPDFELGFPLSVQEESCRAYCASSGLEVLGVIREHCGDEDSVERIMNLLEKLPEGTDVLMASSFTDYSHHLRYLGLAALLYMSRGVELCSEDLPGPIRKHLPFIVPADYRESDKWRELPLPEAIQALKAYRKQRTIFQ
ncbi:MAG: hypothetical protein IKS05_01605 [Oscillospiraceae bacterium]|nr:hypothetical protein [Oscillospiraceae bacterium]